MRGSSATARHPETLGDVAVPQRGRVAGLLLPSCFVPRCDVSQDFAGTPLALAWAIRTCRRTALCFRSEADRGPVGGTLRACGRFRARNSLSAHSGGSRGHTVFKPGGGAVPEPRLRDAGSVAGRGSRIVPDGFAG